MTPVTDGLGAADQGGHVSYTLPDDAFDQWVTSGGPERFALLAPLKEKLSVEPAIPANLRLCVEPLNWLLKRARAGKLPLTKDGWLPADFAAEANRELGFDTPATFEGVRTHLEVDALLQLARNMGASWPEGRREVLSDCGRVIVNSPRGIWNDVSTCLGMARPPGIAGAVWEATLGWLLNDEFGIDPFFDTLEELTGATPPPVDPRLSTEPTFFDAIPVLHTTARALSMFDRSVMSLPPTLTEMGTATVTCALRAIVMYEAYPAGQPFNPGT